MTMDWAEANALVRAADQAGVRFCVAQNYRYFANMATIKQLLDAPEHPHHPGAVQIVDFVHHRYRPEPRTLNYPYAMVWDMSCHHVDLLAFWLGAARRVTAQSYNSAWSQYTHDANIAAIIEYAGGVVCHYVLTHSATISDWRIILQGERGALRTEDVPGVQFYPRPSGQLGSASRWRAMSRGCRPASRAWPTISTAISRKASSRGSAGATISRLWRSARCWCARRASAARSSGLD